jgi:hypothetical protein
MEVSGWLHIPAALPLRKIDPSRTHWIVGWVGPGAGLDAAEKNILPCRESNPGIQPVAIFFNVSVEGGVHTGFTRH